MNQKSSDPIIGRTIDGRYRVLSRIARGGMATVYLATDERLERRVAIKIMHHHLTDDDAFRDRFIREARSAARLAHPNVVSVFDQGQDREMAYLVMEYLPGITLRELLNEHGKLTVEQSIDIMDAVLAGLAAAHSAGIVHRDIKPENVLLADDGRIKLSDFGLARPSTNATATGQALMGTIAYLSPELVTRGVADVRSDIYAVGIMLFEILTGRQPYEGEEPMQIAYQHANDTVPPPSSLVHTIPDELDELVLWATARDPEDRPANAGEMVLSLREIRPLIFPETAGLYSQTTILEPALEQTTYQPLTNQTQVIGDSVPKTHPSRTSTGVLEQRAKRRNRRGRVWFSIVLLLALLAGGTGWYFGSGPGGMVTVPELRDYDVSVAEAELAELDLKFVHDTVYDWQIKTDRVSKTSPAHGEQVQKGTEVTIFLSLGARSLDVPDLIGKDREAAEKGLRDADFTVGPEVPGIFSKNARRGTVIDMLDQDRNQLTSKDQYPEQAPITLVYSAGSLPELVDISYNEAKDRLEKANLVVKKGQELYDENIAEGRVVSFAHGEVLREGDTVTLNVSKGPAPVEVPDVIGWTWADAKPKLEAAGFKLDYNPGMDLVPFLIRVTSVNPEPGTHHPRGTVLQITANDWL